MVKAFHRPLFIKANYLVVSLKHELKFKQLYHWTYPSQNMATKTGIHIQSSSNKSKLLSMVKSIIPPISYDNHKGQCGRIGIIGGSIEYTGAPYFAAISALKVGADLVHVFCCSSAAPIIKSYSPELIVHPLLDQENAVSEIKKWLPRLHSVVIGPGLGRDSQVLSIVELAIDEIKKLNIPMVIDADGLHLIQSNVGLITKLPEVILTPNIVEFNRLYETVLSRKAEGESTVEETKALSIALGNVTILRKGQADVITDGESVLECTLDGSPRRCGGQGDLLSGSLGAFAYWAHKALKNRDQKTISIGPWLTAAYASSYLTRKCNQLAFARAGRSTLTSDMINEIPKVMENLSSTD